MNFPKRAESLYQDEIIVKMVKIAFPLTPYKIIILAICHLSQEF